MSRPGEEALSIGAPMITVAERAVRRAFYEMWDGTRTPSDAFVLEIARRMIAEGHTEENRKVVAVVEIAARESHDARIVRAHRELFGTDPDASFIEHAAKRLRAEEGRTS